MLILAIAFTFGAYSVGSYGWVLIRGWDIPLRAWMSPVNPYSWPADGSDPPTIDPSKLFPTSKSGAAATPAAPSPASPAQPAQPAPFPVLPPV